MSHSTLQMKAEERDTGLRECRADSGESSSWEHTHMPMDRPGLKAGAVKSARNSSVKGVLRSTRSVVCRKNVKAWGCSSAGRIFI